MPRDELVKWIEENKAGYSKDELREYLIKNDWDAGEVGGALDAAWGSPDQSGAPTSGKKGLGGGAAALLISIFFVIGIAGGFFGGMYCQKSITPEIEDCPKCETETNENTSKNMNSGNNNNSKNTNSAKNYNLENDNERNSNSSTNLNTSSKNYNDNENEENTNSTSSNLNAAEYLDEVIPLLEEMDEVSKAVADASGESTVSDDNIMIIQESSELFRSILRNLSKINAPEELEGYNKLLTKALEKYIDACTDLGTGYVTNDDALINEGEDKIQEAADLLHDAADELG